MPALSLRVVAQAWVAGGAGGHWPLELGLGRAAEARWREAGDRRWVPYAGRRATCLIRPHRRKHDVRLFSCRSAGRCVRGDKMLTAVKVNGVARAKRREILAAVGQVGGKAVQDGEAMVLAAVRKTDSEVSENFTFLAGATVAGPTMTGVSMV